MTSTFTVALVGNPNTGKTTLFNRLTGSRQRVGNYPGVTVEKKVGNIEFESGKPAATLIDLPGTYSLAARSVDERVTIDVLNGHIDGTNRPNVIVCVVDATNLLRNLFLFSQAADLQLPIVIALNMSDAAKQQGIVIDTDLLSERLGVPVIPTVASKGKGIDALQDAIEKTGQVRFSEGSLPRQHNWPTSVDTAVAELEQSLSTEDFQLSRSELLRILFDADSAIPARLGVSEKTTSEAIAAARQHLIDDRFNPLNAEALLRYGWLAKDLEGVVTHPEKRKVTKGETADRILTHRIWGVLFLLGLMTLVFQSIYTFAVPLMDGIDWFFGSIGEVVGGWLANMPMLQSLVVDGVIGGIGGVVIFLPQILILFFFIALLEDTGYMARAAFLMDKLFSWCGLNGRSFVPMLSSYACAIPGVMAARTIEDKKARLVTILIAPLMSCSARLPVYVLLIGAFIEPIYGPLWAGIALVLMHLIGLFVAIPVAWLLNKFLIRGKHIPFVMEMPPYRTPKLGNVLWRMWQSAMKFLKRAGTIIFAMTIIIWALSYFPRPVSVEQNVSQQFVAQQSTEMHLSESEITAELEDENSPLAMQLANQIDGAYVEQSYLGRTGRAIQPVFDPAGFDWKITVGVLASFPAREVVVATLGILYNLGGDVDEGSADLSDALRASTWQDGPRAGQPVFTPVVAIGIMVFFALCLQCGATVAVMAREAGWGWAIFAFIYMTALAWLGAVVVYQVGALL